MRMLLWGKVSEGAGPTPWDNTCNDLRNPSQPVHYSDQHSSVCVCDVNSALRDFALGVQTPAGLGFQVLLAKGWPGVIKP